MRHVATTLTLADLSRLGKQIEFDRSVSPHELRQRDHAIGLQCDAPDDVGRLLFWLRSMPDHVIPVKEVGIGVAELSAANVMRLFAFGFGFMGMCAFLLSGENGRINIYGFLSLFVLIQVVFCLVSSFVMIKSWQGDAPVVFPLNLAKLVVTKTIPDRRYLRESQSVVRILLLRYGQEIGAIFTLGAAAAYYPMVRFNPINFVWGSSVKNAGSFERDLTTFLSLPWSSWLPDATLSAQVIEGSRYNKLDTNVDPSFYTNMHDWWPFLIMAMLCYALLPRIILWALSKLLYVKLMRRSFVQYPGSESILLRMKSPLVRTQALESEEPGHVESSGIPLDDGLLLLAWAGALDAGDLGQFEEIRMVPTGNVLAAGLGTLADDDLCIQEINQFKPSRLLVVVKSWEPPMAEFQDFLNRLKEVTRCTLYLEPLPGHAVTDLHLQEWRDFARELHFDAVDTQPLTYM